MSETIVKGIWKKKKGRFIDKGIVRLNIIGQIDVQIDNSIPPYF